MSEDDLERRRVRMHQENESVREDEQHNVLEVQCPFCGAWEDTHTLAGMGCECGAVARTELVFEREEG